VVDVLSPSAVLVLAEDPLVREGALACIAGAAVVRSVDAGDAADVLLVLAGTVTESVLLSIRDAVRASRNPRMRVVLVAETITETQVVRAVEYGLSALLLRPDISFADIVEAIDRSGREAVLPGFAMRTLAGYVRRTRKAPAEGLSPRDIEVLRMIADGAETSEIADRLRYSERTIKNIINGMMKRLSLRNRAHAVSYAMRAGLI
jgi:DNA-binding NarL/FixJ family response regulator